MVLLPIKTNKIYQTPPENSHLSYWKKGKYKCKYYPSNNLLKKILPDIMFGGAGPAGEYY